MTALLVLLAAIAASALCAGAETGYYAVNALRLRYLARSSRRAALLQRTVRSPAGFLVALLIGNNIANSLAVNSGVAFATGDLGMAPGQASFWTTVILTPVVFLLGEVGPKQLLLASPLRRMLNLAPLLSVLRLVLLPVTAPLVVFLRAFDRAASGSFTRHELSALLLEGRRAVVGEAPVLGAALRALESRGRGLRPYLREDLPMLPAGVSGAEALRRLAASTDALALLERPGASPALLDGRRLVGAPEGTPPLDLAEELPVLPAETDLAAALAGLRRLGADRALVGRPGAWEGVCDLEYLLAILLAPAPTGAPSHA